MKIMVTKYKLWIVFVGLALLAVSCKVGKKYTRPELNLPEEVAGVRGDSASVDSLYWWDLYTDPVLQRLIVRTLEYNQDMQIAAARVKELMALQRMERADLFPKVDAKVHADREHDQTPDNTFELKAMLSWELDLWGKLRWANQAAISEYLQSVEGRRALQLSLVAQVAQSYFELTALDQELSIVNQTLEARREGVRLAKLRFEGGLTSETSLRQAEVELARTQTLTPELERKIRLKENEISLLTGQYPGRIERGRNIVGQHLPDSIPVGLPSELLERRPDIRQAEYRLKAAHAKVGVAYTNMFPKIALTGHYGLESNALSDFLKSPYYYLGGELLSPLFNMGKNRAKLKAARAVQEQETYRYRKVVLNAFTEVNNALISSRKSREIRESRKNLEDAARAYLDLATLQYINGVISYIDVLDAQRGYFDAQTGLNNAIRDELLAVVNLYKALGGGFQSPAGSPFSSSVENR